MKKAGIAKGINGKMKRLGQGQKGWWAPAGLEPLSEGWLNHNAVEGTAEL